MNIFFFRLLIWLFSCSLEYLWCIPTASRCSCDQWWIQLRIFGITCIFKCTVAEQSTRWSVNHRLGQPTKQTFSSLSSRPNSVEQDRFRKENVDECSYRACVQRNKPSQECRKVHISTVTFLYDVGPLVALSCFLNDNNSRHHSSGGSSWPRQRRARLVPHLSLCTGWSCHSWLRRHQSFSAVPAPVLVTATCLRPLSLGLHLCTTTLWKPVSWTRISPDSLGHSEATASVSLLEGKKVTLWLFYLAIILKTNKNPTIL